MQLTVVGMTGQVFGQGLLEAVRSAHRAKGTTVS